MHRIIWIPWERSEAYEFLERSENWLQERPDKNFQIVLYNPARASVGLGEHPALMNLVNGSQIYMRGHGQPGSSRITTNLAGGRAISMDITESIDRLLEMGLPGTYRGTIKFYSCFSAVKGKPKYLDGGQLKLHKNPMKTTAKGGNWTTGPFHPLAKIGANYFRSLGFQHCKYLGYKGPLTGKYVDSDATGENHKYCERVTFDGLGQVHFDKNKDRRASDARKSF